MPDDAQSSPRSPTPVSPHSTSNNLKRKEPPDDDGKANSPDDNFVTAPNSSSATHTPHADEYEAGFITCQTCGTEVSFRDDNNGFTTKLWDAHRMTCSTSRPPASSSGPVMFTQESVGDPLGHPPTKRRRAKRTEEERIEYLRSDPYVGQFEAYRVLCASCDKWIRLRPNSTYCSIPWDAHRKSCLAKKINNKNVYALEERNSLFSKDPDVRKFDPERLLCNICDKWLSLPPDDHLQAVQKWLQHRATCQRNATASSSSATRISQEVQNIESQRSPPVSDPSSPKRTISSTPQRSITPPQADVTHHRYPPFSAPPPGSPPFHALTPSNYGPAHESRRRNAEQRAANLREDPYIAEVEPNRVFCKLCQKWVQLRQDSSYCAYPWMQHRQKCEARHFRRTQKAAEVAEMRTRKQPLPPPPVHHEEDELLSDREAIFAPRRSVRGSEDVESEEGMESLTEDGTRRREMKARVDQRHFLPPPSSRHFYSPPQPPLHSHQPPYYVHPAHHYKSRSAPMPYGPSTSNHKYMGGSSTQGISMSSRQDRAYSYSRPHSHTISHPPRGHSHVPRLVIGRHSSMDEDVDADAEGEADMDTDRDVERDVLNRDKTSKIPTTPTAHSSRAINMTRGLPRRPLPIGLADLDSAVGRKQFIFASVEYLFSSTYESTDEMSISALLAYLNAAMPPDKHEDFDTTEVVRAVASMKEKGKVVFEGDILRLVD